MCMINIYNIDINKYTLSAKDAISSGWISNHGKYIELASEKLKNTINSKYCILMSNGTCATHCLFLSLKFKYPHINKIYVSNNSYVAAINCILMEYKIEEIELMKMSLDTWNIDTNEEYINSLEKNSAVLIVHNLGNIINVPRLKKIRPDIIFLEDNCEGLFGKYNDCYSGMTEDILCSSSSFYGNKIITTGEGGAFYTQHKDVYEYIKKAYSQGMSSTRYLHEVHAYNYRMTNIQAGFLYDQLNDIDNVLDNKYKIFKTYDTLLKPYGSKIKLMKKEDNTINAPWIYAIRIVNNKSIEDTIDFFKKNNIDIRPFFYPMNSHHHLQSIKNEDEISYILNKEIIMIPSSPDITFEEQKRVVDVIKLYLEKCMIYKRNVLENDLFDSIDKNTIFELDNLYYKHIRENINNFINESICTFKDKLILEIGPKKNIEERIKSKDNIIETVDIIENNTTYVCDLTKDNIIPNDRYDVIYCLEVLEHTYEPYKIIEQLYSKLKQNGLLYLSVPFNFRLHGPLPDNYRISEYGLKYLLEKNNFEIIEFYSLNDKTRPSFPIHYTIICKKF